MASASARAAVLFQGVSRHFAAIKAVDQVDLIVAEGEFFAMLGPSGSGKTTCLRLIAGFEQPTSGHIEIFGRTAEGLPPYARDVNTVFQDYALFPHMTVLDNVGYGLRVKGVGRNAREKQARDALALVRLEGYDGRRPAQLSGGQRQRVALARALVNRPKVLLLDEPLGALDLKLREDMQDELRGLHKTLGLTFVFVTHDQGEALSMADRVAVFNAGKIVQVGTPQAIYEQPATRFVADFVGSANVLSPGLAQALGGEARWTSLRPERIALVEGPREGWFTHEARVAHQHYQGAQRRLTLALTPAPLQGAMAPLHASVPADCAIDTGQMVRIGWPIGALHAMPGEPA